MKVGVLQFFSWPERRVAIETVYERALQRIEIMDRTGYDAVWLAEHHFHSFSVCPSVHVMGTHVAARTQRLRIGTAVSLAALYHPLRLAEEVALLDVLSGGRVYWGAGRGFDRTEFLAFGVPQDESAPRFQEAVDIVRARLHACQRCLVYLDRLEGRTGHARQRVIHLIQDSPWHIGLYAELLKSCVPSALATKLRVLREWCWRT